MKELAVYGKGGIGKSTLSANISAALARQGKKILQIGCDPKHDSTRALMGGQRITTVLDYIRTTPAVDCRLEDILFHGYQGIGCIEAGGPKPGVGCAGRGIITAFELLEKFHIKEQYDLILYDVLGDVVCGGFAVPIRREYADTIFLVTSGEYMSMYAANNILRGIQNYDGEQCRIAGILFNGRNVKDEEEKVRRFAQAVELPVFARIPRDDVFARAEKQNCTVVEMEEETGGAVSRIFDDIARRIIAVPQLYAAKPLTDEALEELLLYGRDSRTSTAPTVKPCPTTVQKEKEAPAAGYDTGYLSKNVLRDEPLHGCAFSGAMAMSVHLRDAVILAHSPKSCTYLTYQSISSLGRRHLYERGVALPIPLQPNIISSEMDESDMVFGGTDKLLDTVQRVKSLQPRPKAIVIISSCPSGIIGDDIDEARKLAEPDLPVVTIKTEGNLTGDYLQGMLMAYIQLAEQVIDPTAAPEENVVNIVFEKVVAKNTESNFRIIHGWLQKMGIRVNCRFLYDTSYDSLRRFCSAPLNLLAYRDYTGQILEDFFTKKYGSRFYAEQFPVGFAESERWLRGVGAFFGKEEQAEEIIAKNRQEYEARIAAIRPVLAGKRLMVLSYNYDLDWILQTALDVGMEIVKLCFLTCSQDEGFRSHLPGIEKVPMEMDYDRTRRDQDIQTYRPDIVLSNYDSSVHYEQCIVDTIPLCPDNGFFSGVLMAERWANLLHMDLEGEWKNDQRLFNKYYSR